MTSIEETFFIKQYPYISFSDLEKQNDYYQTDDECVHYKHKMTKIIYSWNFVECIWIENMYKNIDEIFF